MDIRKTSKLIDKAYWRDDQRLWVSSIEVIEGVSAGPYSIYTVNPKTKWHEHYLFDIQNYNALWEWDYSIPSNILKPEYRMPTQRFDVVKASCSPFYHAKERIFTIPKFTKITKDDILFCTKWFLRNVTDNMCLFNIKWYTFEDNGQLEFEFDK